MPPPCGHTEPRIKVEGRFVEPNPPMGAPGYCGQCIAAATNQDLRKRWGMGGRVLTLKPGVLKEGPKEKAKKAGGPCRHRSKSEVDGPTRQKLGLPHGKTWYECGHPAKPNPQARLSLYVCPCEGCNANCKGYATGGQ